MRNKLVCLILILLCLGMPAFALAEPLSEEDIPAANAILIDAESGTVLFEKEADAKAYPASTTKIMSCILALEHGNLDDVVTVGDVTSRGSLMGIRRGETMSLRSLLYGMMLPSGNDAAEAVAAHIGGSFDGFVQMMNEKAQELGMTGTHFTQPSGLHKDEHYTTARDMARLTRYALTESEKQNDFRAIVKRGTYNVTDSSAKKYELNNTNKLVHTREGKDSFEYSGAIGVKTGSTPAGGECLVAAAERNGVTLICVQLAETNEDRRFTSAAKMFDYGFENLVSLSAQELGLPTALSVTVKNCSFDDEAHGLLDLDVDLTGVQITGLKDAMARMQADSSAITANIVPNGEIVAPVEEGAAIATVAYQFEGETILTAEAFAARSVAAMASGNLATPGGAELIEGRIQQEKTGSPWVFWAIVLVGILIVVIVVRLLLNSRQRRRRPRRRGGYAYRRR